jgi:hypothetical protein
MSDALVPWTAADVDQWGAAPLNARHRLHEPPTADLFSDAGLEDLLDRMPRDRVHIYTMGTDPARPEDWASVAQSDLPGAELLEAVGRGRLWLNILRVDESIEEMRELVDRMYAELAALRPGFAPIRRKATLLVSSPASQVYFHADTQPNLLWHVRGRKRVWVYPALDGRFCSTVDLQKIFTNETEEELPYDPAWDSEATVYDLVPGDVASWPQNAPHRVVNVEGLNVSLSTEHTTRETQRRGNVWAANRVLSSRLHLPVSATKESGPSAAAKVLTIRAARRAGLFQPPVFERVPTFEVDPEAPDALRRLASVTP